MPRFLYLLIYMYIYYFNAIKSTIDMNMQELEYLSDHLHPEECRRLFASVHFASYDIPNSLDQVENQVSNDIPCIRLLLHWNSAVGEGKGETHDVIEHRLRQMGKQDLADWLGKTVFHQLSIDLQNSLKDPFHDFKENDTFENNTYIATTVKIEDVTEWWPMDTILLTIIIILIVVMFMVFLKACLLTCKQKKKSRKTRFSNKKSYKELENVTTDDESEDVFDIRTQTQDSSN